MEFAENGRRRPSPSASLGRASTFLVHHPQPGPRSRSRADAPLHILRASASPSTPALAGPSPALSSAADTSRLPLDLLEPAAARWASTAGRGSRAAPRVRSTVGPQSDVVDTGVFVCPNTVVAALPSPAGRRDDVVVTAECGGWLRVREQRTGTIRHQQQLRNGNEASCLAWAAPRSAVPTVPQTIMAAVVVVGQLSGLVSFFALVGESLVEMPAATCVLHEAPILACVPLGSAAGTALLLTMDADGVVALWELHQEGGAAGGAAGLAARLVNCSYACGPEAAEGVGASPPVIVSAGGTWADASAAAPLSIPHAVFSTHQLVEASEADVPVSNVSGLVYGLAYTQTENAEGGGAAGQAQVLETTSLTMPTALSDTGVSALTDTTDASGSRHHHTQDGSCRWTVRRVYSLPQALRSSPSNRHVTITALCPVSSSNNSGSRTSSDPSAQIWAGTSDGRIFIWQVGSGEYVRCLHSPTTSSTAASAAAIHHLVCVATQGSGPLVWASQADGSVVAWSGVHYAVVEVLPLSYPPPLPTDVEGLSDGTVTVRDGVDLLRATRHLPPLSSSSSSPVDMQLAAAAAESRRRGGFTLFVQPMELVSMQRAWSVATDGTVRTWLLPAGEGSVGARKTESVLAPPQEESEAPADAIEGGGGAEGTQPPQRTMLDGYTVQCFLQEKADEVLLERAAHAAQLAALRERNHVLAAALQQAIGRLERVSVDGLVRSTTPRATPSPTPPDSPVQPQARDGGDEESDGDDDEDGRRNEHRASADGRPAGHSVRGQAVLSGHESRGIREREQPPCESSTTSDASLLSSPSAASQPPGTLVATSVAAGGGARGGGAVVPAAAHSVGFHSDAHQHVLALQQLLEELHAKLEESWSRNDALREELLVYQLRTLEREEEMMARRLHDTGASSPTPLLPSPAPHASVGASSGLMAERGTGQKGEEEGGPRSESTPSAGPAAFASDAPSADASSEPREEEAGEPALPRDSSIQVPRGPSSSVAAPSVASQSTARGTEAPAAAGPTGAAEAAVPRPILAPSLPTPSVGSVEEGFDAEEGEGRRSSVHPRVESTSTAAADRFFTAASAALRHRAAAHDGAADHGDDSGGPFSFPSAGAAPDRRAEGRADALTPSRRIRAPPPFAGEHDGDYGGGVGGSVAVSEASEEDEEDGEPALVAAWSTSEAELSPISPSAIHAATPTPRRHGGLADHPNRPQTSSLLSYPYLGPSPSSLSVLSAPPDRGTHTSHRALPHPHASTTTTTTATATSSMRGGRGGSEHPVRLYADPFTSSAAASPPHGRTVGVLTGGSPGPLPAARVTPIRAAGLPSALASPPAPRAFRSPIVYHHF